MRFLFNKYLANIVFLLVVFAIAGDLFIEAYPRKMFYNACYASIIGLVFCSDWKYWRCWVKSNKAPLFFILALFLLGASKFIWSVAFPSVHFEDIKNNYHASGKMFFLASVCACYLYKNKNEIRYVTMQVAMVLSLLLAIATALFGYQEASHGVLRIKLLADAATTTGYILVLQSVIVITLVQHVFKRKYTRLLMLALAIFIFATALMMTETRGAIGSFFIIVFILMCNELRNMKAHHWIIAALIFSMAGCGVAWKMKNRISEAFSDVASLQSDNTNTSIGARVVMLKSGIYVSHFTLFGQDAVDRYNTARAYIEEGDFNSPEAIRSIGYHFHNEVIESLSLQGVFGFLSLLAFYVMGLIVVFNKQLYFNMGLLSLIVSLGLMGLTDVIMIQSNTAMVIGACCIITIIGSKSKYQ